jgi:O-antigen ligase
MISLAWVAGIWSLFIVARVGQDRRAGRQSDWLNRETIALLLALLGTYAIAEQTTAEELLREPVVAERMARGVLAAISLLISGPIVVNRLRNGNSKRTYPALTALGVYCGVAVLTVLYSAAPLVTAAKAFELAAGLAGVGAAALATDGLGRLRRMVTFVLGLEGTLLVTAVFGFFLMPGTFSFISPYRHGFIAAETMGAPFASANVLSATGAVLVTYGLARLLDSRGGRRRLWWLMVIGIALMGALLASGRQGIVMLAAGVFLLLWFRRRTLFLTLIGPATVLAVWAFWDQAFMIFSRGQPQLLSNLTGRLPWWESAIEVWAVHPWTGYGYGAGGRFVGLANIGSTSISNVHNGYIEALVGVGLIGFIPLLVGVILVIAWSLGAIRAERDVPLAILIVPLVLHTFIDLGFGGWLKPDIILLACLAGIRDWSRHQARLMGTNPDRIYALTG